MTKKTRGKRIVHQRQDVTVIQCDGLIVSGVSVSATEICDEGELRRQILKIL